VGGPLDDSCRIEGLLDTVAGRGRDLQLELDESNRIEENLQDQLRAAIDKEPNHPIVTELPKPEHIFIDAKASRDYSDTQPSTPTSQNENISQPLLQTPEELDSDFFIGGSGSSGRLDPRRNEIPSFRSVPRPAPESPVSIDNADLGHARFPGYRRSSSNEDFNQRNFGCGSSFLADTTHLFYNTHEEDYENNSTIHRTSSVIETSTVADVAPVQTSSFDQVDFRTGLSGHRSLHTAKSRILPPSRVRMMMSEHRGIASVRQTSRDSPLATPQVSQSTSSSPLFGASFVPLNWASLGGGSS
jgi:hypothetical protein